MSSAEAGGWTSSAIQHNLNAGCMAAAAGTLWSGVEQGKKRNCLERSASGGLFLAYEQPKKLVLQRRAAYTRGTGR